MAESWEDLADDVAAPAALGVAAAAPSATPLAHATKESEEDGDGGGGDGGGGVAGTSSSKEDQHTAAAAAAAAAQGAFCGTSRFISWECGVRGVVCVFAPVGCSIPPFP